MSIQLPTGMNLSHTPVMANPSGAPPNFDNPPSLNKLSYGLASTMMLLAFGPVGLRALSVLKKDRGLMLDDYLCLIAWVLASTYAIIVMITNSTSRHTWDMPISFVNKPWLMKNAIMGIIYPTTMFFAKAAVCALYARIFGSVRWMRYTAWSILAVLAAVYLFLIPIYALYASPYGSNRWDLSFSLKMNRLDAYAVATGAFNVTTDLVFLILPLPIIPTMNLSCRKKVGLYAVFLTGIIGILAKTLGLFYRVLMYKSRPGQGDPSWAASKAYLTVVFELYIIIMVSCTPGCVASWRNVLRETSFIVAIRTLFDRSRTSILGPKSMKHSSKPRIKGRCFLKCSDEISLAWRNECGFVERGDVEYGVLKTVRIQQSNGYVVSPA